MSYWKQSVKNFFIAPESGRIKCSTEIDSTGHVAVNFGNSFTIRLSENDAIRLRDAISISVIKIQDGIINANNSSRITNGDMG